jgi:hypothetical protein
MHQPLGEFVMAADMVEMRVAGDRETALFGHQRHMAAQADHPHPGIDQHVAVAAPHVPDVAAVEFLDERFADIGHVVADPACLIPGSRRDPPHGRSGFNRTRSSRAT